MVECPNLSCTIFGWAPCFSIREAWLCRASWKRITFMLTLLANKVQALLTVFGNNGAPSSRANTRLLVPSFWYHPGQGIFGWWDLSHPLDEFLKAHRQSSTRHRIEKTWCWASYLVACGGLGYSGVCNKPCLYWFYCHKHECDDMPWLWKENSGKS